MKILSSLAVGAAFFVGLVVTGAPASAAGPQPATCWGSAANDGQYAAGVHTFLGANDQPGLSSFNHGLVGSYVVGLHETVCGF
jgi:hypothetical protein